MATDPMRIRAQAQGGNAIVRVLMMHEMETGQRKDAAGKIVPLHFIQSIGATLNGKPVFSADISQAISRNPVFAFKVKGARAGDTIAITWTDNKGETRTDQAVVRAAP